MHGGSFSVTYLKQICSIFGTIVSPNEVAEIIRRYREQNGEPPADMMAIYNYLHEEQIEKATEVKTMQTMYKGS